MQWGWLTGWGVLIWRLGARKRLQPLLKILIALALMLSMGTQLWLLFLDGLLTLETALPLHLCGFFGMLTVLLLWRLPPWYCEAIAFLGAPGALCALFFPAVIRCSHPLWMQAAFSQLHALLTLMPLYLWRTGKPLPTDPRRTLMLGSGYLLFVSAFNRAFHTNYLFLRAAPAGTPLALLFSRGAAFYQCALILLCMLVFAWLAPLYAHCRK